MENKKVKFEIDNGQAFFADEIGIMHNPLRIILDFRSITPRLDMRNQEYQPLVLKHNVVVMDPYSAKSMLDLLTENLKKYEDQFGEITKPEALKKLEKSNSEESKGKSKKDTAPAYFG